MLQLNVVTLRACWGELISLMVAQVQVSSQECPKAMYLEKEDFSLFSVTNDSQRKIRD